MWFQNYEDTLPRQQKNVLEIIKDFLIAPDDSDGKMIPFCPGNFGSSFDSRQKRRCE